MVNLKEKLQKYIDKYLKEEHVSCVAFLNITKHEICKNLAYDVSESSSAKVCSEPVETFIKETIDPNDFKTVLFRMIEERNLNDSEVYNKVHIDRRLFSKIRSDKNYHPSKETVILFGLSLELKVGEIEELLDSAAYSLPKTNNFDLIIRFCFLNRIYDVNTVNDLLDEYNCRLLNC